MNMEDKNREKNLCVSIVSGPLEGHKFLVKSDSPILVGRDKDATIKIDYDNYCSRKHAIIYWDKNICFIEDLNSKNGTFVNEERVFGKRKLLNKDFVSMGSTKLIILIGDKQEDISARSLQNYAPGRAKVEGKIGVGDFIGEDFDIYQVIEGGMGTVYVCYNNKDGNMYALKAIKETLSFRKDGKENEEDANLMEMFNQEALAWVALGKHPYIVRAYTVQRFSAELCYRSKLYIIMEYITPDTKGRNTLSHYLGGLTYTEALKIAIQLSCGLQYAYSKGIKAHRDIKPNNIMITPDLTVKITDFGIAKSIDTSNESNLIACGTLPYMAPEQFDGNVDKKSDIYSFGIVLYQLAAGGNLPFFGENPSEYRNLHKHAKTPALDSPLAYIIEKCLQKNPEKRCKDFDAIQEELQKLFQKETGKKLEVFSDDKNFGFRDWVDKGRALDALHKYQEAIYCYDKALDINSENIETWYWKSIALVMLKKYEEANRCCDKILEINPSEVTILTQKGKILECMGKHSEAIACYDKALKTSPDCDSAQKGKKYVLFELGNYDEAISWLSKMLTINPNNFEAWLDKAEALCHLGKYQEAIHCYEKALAIKPGHSYILGDKGKALAKLNKYSEAINCFDKALEMDGIDVSLLIDKVVVLIDAGQHKDALCCCDKILEINPECGDALYYKAAIFYKLNQFKESLVCIDMVLKLDSLQIPKESYELKQKIIQNLKE
jgi:serine/threonine protein kinase